ncbi:SNF2-related protein [Rhodospirillum sp. A1_3_36]|uniref:DEAD/DEAH box helicase n=1 Tax=Rhodospirillum sp. A1_3_36 TaxID=3391666 RepID=UPI0039A55C2A
MTSLDTLRRKFSETTWERGARYQRADRARVTEVSHDGRRVSGTVSGTRSRPYVTHMTVKRDRSGKLTIVGSCSCPMEVNCKHVVALLLQAKADGVLRLPSEPSGGDGETEDRDRVVPAERDVLSPEITSWLQTLEKVGQGEAEAYPDSIRQRLVYVLSVEDGPGLVEQRELEVEVLSTRLLKDGSFSSTVHSYDPSRVYGPQGGGQFLRPSDRKILKALDTVGRMGWGQGVLKGEDGVEILETILKTGRGRWEDINGPILTRGPSRQGRLTWTVGRDGRQRPTVEPASELASTGDGGEGESASLCLLPLVPPWLVRIDPTDPGRMVASPLALDVSPRLLEALLAAPPLGAGEVEAVRTKLSDLLGERGGGPVPLSSLPRSLPKARRVKEALVPCLRLFTVKAPKSRVWGESPFAIDGDKLPLARPWFRYGEIDIGVSEAEKVVTHLIEETPVEIKRAIGQEGKALTLLADMGFTRAISLPLVILGPEHRDDLTLPPDMDRDLDSQWVEVLLDDVPRLREAGWFVEVADDFPLRPVLVDGNFEAEVAAGEGSGIDWLDLNLGVMVDGERVDLLPPLLGLLEQIPADVIDDFLLEDAGEGATLHVRGADGRVLVLPFERLRPILQALIGLMGGGGREGASGEGLRLSALDMAELVDFEETLSGLGVAFKGAEAERALCRRLRDIGGSVPEVTLPPAFLGELRPYQAVGVAWMQLLRETGIGGILADDMGLGKTVQALAHLSIEKAEGRLDRPSLLIAPTSLMGNWRAEAARFAPELKTLVLHGPDRKADFDRLAEYDLVLCTYPLLTRDGDVLAGQDWSLLILDEAQTVKNPRTTAAKVLARLSARHRLALTGTPVENNLGDLWALYNAVSPGLLGDRTTFTKRWRTPIEKKGDIDLQGTLSRRLRPYLLRRTKTDVLAELPPLTDIVEHVALEDEQRAVYEAIRLAMHAKVREAIARKGLARSHIELLEALLRMRQVCCDPRLVAKADLGGKGAKARQAGSAKLERLLEMLPELIAEGRRVLLFSQFTSMLDLIEQAIGGLGIPYVTLTGKTRDREAVVNRFQAGEVPLFLISLKAGGTGLNLTAADTVIHYDPWWNPAVERQATDRAYRMGQDKPVFVHRLIAEETIEVKMQALKDRKQALADGLYDEDGATPFDIGEEDIEYLLGRG